MERVALCQLREVLIRFEVQRTSGEKALLRENSYAINDENDDLNEVEEHAGVVCVVEDVAYMVSTVGIDEMWAEASRVPRALALLR